MWKFTNVVCNFFTLVLAAVLCGILAFVADPHLTTGYHSPMSLVWLAMACCSGYFSALFIHYFGNLLLSGGDANKPWYFNPAAGAYLLAAIGILVFACYQLMSFRIQLLHALGESPWGIVFAHLTVTLLVLAFFIGMHGVPARHNQPHNDDYSEPAEPPYMPPMPPLRTPKALSCDLTHYDD